MELPLPGNIEGLQYTRTCIESQKCYLFHPNTTTTATTTDAAAADTTDESSLQGYQVKVNGVIQREHVVYDDKPILVGNCQSEENAKLYCPSGQALLSVSVFYHGDRFQSSAPSSYNNVNWQIIRPSTTNLIYETVFSSSRFSNGYLLYQDYQFYDCIPTNVCLTFRVMADDLLNARIDLMVNGQAVPELKVIYTNDNDGMEWAETQLLEAPCTVKDNDIRVGAIIGIVVGSCILLIGAVAIGVYRHNTKKRG